MEATELDSFTSAPPFSETHEPPPSEEQDRWGQLCSLDSGIWYNLDSVSTPVLGKEINDKFNSEASASDDGFTNRDLWVKGNASLRLHKKN